MSKPFDRTYFSNCYGDYFRQNPPSKLRFYLNLLNTHVQQGRLLDIGCSYGLFANMACDRYSVVGMDVDPEVVGEAAGHAPRAAFVAGRLPHIPFTRVDIITLLDVIEHVPDLEETMARIRDTLAPNGIVLMVVPVYDGPLGWLVRRLDADPTHIHKYSRTFWLDLAGHYFEIAAWQGSFRKLFLGRWYLHVPTKRLRAIAPALVMVLRSKADQNGTTTQKREPEENHTP